MDDTVSPSTYASNSEIASISAKIMISTITVVFLLMLIFFCIYIYAKCQMSFTYLEDPNVVAWRRREARRARARGPGLDPSELGSIPIVEYNPKEFKDGLECAVCLSELTQGEKARILPKCNHGFHVNCIDMWLQSHSTCPICRNPIVPLQTPSNVPTEVQENGSSSSDSDDDDYASIEAPSEEENASSGSLRREELVIEVPTVIFEDCQEELQEKSPVMTRMMSLKRLLSRGKRAMAPSPRASSSRDVEQQV